MNRVVALEVQPQEDRHAPGGSGCSGQVEQQIHPGSIWLVGEQDRDFAADSLATECLLVLGPDVECGADRPGRLRHLAVDVGLEKPQQLGAPDRGPLCPGRDFLAGGGHQRIWQRVVADLALIVVGRGWFVRWGRDLAQAGNRDGRPGTFGTSTRDRDQENQSWCGYSPAVRVGFLTAAFMRRAICFIISRSEMPIQQWPWPGP